MTFKAHYMSWDNLLLLAMAVVLASSVPVYRHIDRGIGFVKLPPALAGSGGQVAVLENVSREVRVRGARDLDWTPAVERTELYREDLVRTMANSRAEIRLARGLGVVVVDGNSMVRVQAPERPSLTRSEASTIHVTEGEVRVRASSAELRRGGLRIQTEDGSEVRVQERRDVGIADETGVALPEHIRLGASEDVDITVRSEAGRGTTIEAHSGRAEIVSGGRAVTLEAGQTLQVERDGAMTARDERGEVVAPAPRRVTPGTPELSAPTPGAVLKTRRPTLEWRPARDAESYVLLLTDETGRTRTLKAAAARYEPAEDLAAGGYEWKVRGVSADGTEGPLSPAAGFEIRPPAPPRLEITDFNWE